MPPQIIICTFFICTFISAFLLALFRPWAAVRYPADVFRYELLSATTRITSFVSEKLRLVTPCLRASPFDKVVSPSVTAYLRVQIPANLVLPRGIEPLFSP
jgi:hypothetical protein